VNDVRCARSVAVAQHVRHVLGELQRAPRALRRLRVTGRKPRGAVEALDATVAVWRWHRAVGETAREQLDIRPGCSQRAAQRVVVRRRVRGRVDDVNAHRCGQ